MLLTLLLLTPTSQTGQTWQRSGSIGWTVLGLQTRTVLQTVAPKKLSTGVLQSSVYSLKPLKPKQTHTLNVSLHYLAKYLSPFWLTQANTHVFLCHRACKVTCTFKLFHAIELSRHYERTFFRISVIWKINILISPALIKKNPPQYIMRRYFCSIDNTLYTRSNASEVTTLRRHESQNKIRNPVATRYYYNLLFSCQIKQNDRWFKIALYVSYKNTKTS